ncbi:hypothetical protein PLICRDRAFT_174757 [Plicaturopsis crispa FD-325 SS-3]|nr:hypothetical protein PLICRDRAFT_174757 [Plicaturopsis crispa FD-325 SS-3]
MYLSSLLHHILSLSAALPPRLLTQIGAVQKPHKPSPLRPRYDLDGKVPKTLWELFAEISLPPSPPLYKAGMLAGTRSPTSADLEMPAEDQLTDVVYAPDLITRPLTAVEAHLRATYFDPTQEYTREWLGSVHPTYTCSQLPNKVHSEHDSEAWVFNMVRTAFALYETIGNKKLEGGLEPGFPNMCSGCTATSTPDGVVHSRQDKHGVNVAAATCEVKTPGVFPQILTSGPSRLRLFDGILDTINKTSHTGHSVKFTWPSSDTSFTAIQDSDSKILAQIWAQMHHCQVPFAMLSSYENNLFFAKRGTTLYVSRPYVIGETNVVPAVTAFIAMAMGEFEEFMLDEEVMLPPSHGLWRKTLFSTMFGLEPRNCGNQAIHRDARANIRSARAKAHSDNPSDGISLEVPQVVIRRRSPPHETLHKILELLQSLNLEDSSLQQDMDDKLGEVIQMCGSLKLGARGLPESSRMGSDEDGSGRDDRSRGDGKSGDEDDKADPIEREVGDPLSDHDRGDGSGNTEDHNSAESGGDDSTDSEDDDSSDHIRSSESDPASTGDEDDDRDPDFVPESEEDDSDDA